MAGERPDHTLSPTALVHELHLRLPVPVAGSTAERAAYFRAAGDAMRNILIDHARRRGAAKRGGKRVREIADLESLASDADSEEIMRLEAAFLRLQERDPRAADVVRLRFYAGLGVDETAEALGLSRSTVLRDWEFARVFLFRELE